ncbi:MAG TPA: hypothetical protein VKT72_17195 [Candidatus Baltobacteraceae bacterium]|nr:hypothetical protein [Candidatus Baltobacteraceae bacterium]
MSFAVAGYIVAAYWFTPSTSFANPAVTIARSLSDLVPIRKSEAEAVLVPHMQDKPAQVAQRVV